MSDLLPQQELMIPHILENPIAAVFAEPGLGKTRAVIEALKILFNDMAIRGALIVSPKRVSTMTWPDELREWSDLHFADLRTEEGRERWNKGTAEVWLVNIEQIPQLVEKCFKGRRSIPADVLIIDELSKFRAPNSVRAKKLLAYRKFFKRFIGLTGTPAPNSEMDLFNQIRLLDGGERFGPSFHAFRDRFAYATDYMKYNWKLKDGAAQEIREKISDITISLTAEEFLHIPPVTETDIELDFTPELRSDYRKLEKDALLKIENHELVGETQAVLVGKLQQFCSGAAYCAHEDGGRLTLPVHCLKTDALKKLHEELKREPTLVFYHFKHDLERILEAIPWAEPFDESRAAEWNRGEIPMWLCHPQATGHGLNLQKSCRYVCWFTPTWSNENYVQANKRVARNGQTRPVTIFRILVKDTIDEAVVEAVRLRQEGQSGLMRALRNLKLMADAR